jgi:molecular chaperone DnaK
MSNTINFGIDLGTTNSAIAKYTEGEVDVFKNPINWKQTLPSVVAFKKQRIIIGDKARELLQKDAQNVVGSFKRKMGTSDKYYIESVGEFVSAEDLSAHILKELKNFIHTGEPPNAAVITIPASFDTMQSNATKKAGHQAGFQQVILLQEPIAASLAYANKTKQDLTDKKWIVYDLGGGTFDAALVTIYHDEMKVLDHEGNNYLGGTDFDKAIVEQIIIPYLEAEGTFSQLEKAMKSAAGKYNRLYNLLLFKAEEAKIALTNAASAEIEFETEDDLEEELDVYLTISRAQFNELMKPFIRQTTTMIDNILSRNGLGKSDVDFLLMVGGSTLIPAVRSQLSAHYGVEVNCDIDPTTAVALGAAYYAGMKPRRLPSKSSSMPSGQGRMETDVTIKLAYDKVAQETETALIGQATGFTADKYYRVIRQDGGFDSGLKPLSNGIKEYLPLVPNVYNVFSLKVYGPQNDPIPLGLPEIGITHGKFSIDGQPLPHDICLEIDAVNRETTFLEPIFKKSTILPAKKTIVKEISRNIYKGSDESLVINVLEGPLDNLPSANKTIGHIKISGTHLHRDLIKGSDVELTFEVSESRDLSVKVYLTLSDQEFEDVFNPSETHVDVQSLSHELQSIHTNLQLKLKEAERKEEYGQAARIQQLIAEADGLRERLEALSDDDITDEKYQLDEAKRQLALQLHQMFRNSVLNQSIEEYYQAKNNLRAHLTFGDSTAEDKARFEEAISNEREVLGSGSVSAINMKTTLLKGLIQRIATRTPLTNDDLIAIFGSLKRHNFIDKKRAQRQIKRGDTAIDRQNFALLSEVVDELYRQKNQEKNSSTDSFKKPGTGLK